jgi:hypothetical protein
MGFYMFEKAPTDPLCRLLPSADIEQVVYCLERYREASQQNKGFEID